MLDDGTFAEVYIPKNKLSDMTPAQFRELAQQLKKQ
jgi:hypothetical protein